VRSFKIIDGTTISLNQQIEALSRLRHVYAENVSKSASPVSTKFNLLACEAARLTLMDVAAENAAKIAQAASDPKPKTKKR
jgi:hypothetical protein